MGAADKKVARDKAAIAQRLAEREKATGGAKAPSKPRSKKVTKKG